MRRMKISLHQTMHSLARELSMRLNMAMKSNNARYLSLMKTKGGGSVNGLTLYYLEVYYRL